MNPLLTSSLLTALLQASLLVTGAWLLILTQRKSPAARRSAACRSTMAAAILLIAATLGHTALRLTPDHNPTSGAAALPRGTGLIGENTLLNPSESLSEEKLLTSPTISLAANPSPTGPLMLSEGHAQWLGSVWLTGAALILTVWLRSLAARLTLLRRSENATGAPWLQGAGEITDWPLVDEVRLVPQEITPCVWGVRKSVLALPASAPAWPAAKLKLILAHECAHLLRRDPFWQILSCFFLALLWFHPLAWNLARRSRADDEQAADDIVLNTSGDAPSYANLLVECARQFALPPALQSTASAMAGPTTLTRRVEALLDPATDRRHAGAGTLAMGLAAISLLTITAGLAAPTIEIAPPPPTAPEIPETTADPVAPDPVPASQEPSPIFEPPIAPSSVPQAVPADPTPAVKAPAEAEPQTPVPPKEPFQWKIVSLDGRDYLPVSNIKNFYHFRNLTMEESGTFFLRSQTMMIKGADGSAELFVNNVKFFLKHPTQHSNEGPLISRQDLALVLDPVIRPSYIKGFQKVTTVVIDPGHGGNDLGGQGPEGKESNYTLDTALRLQDHLRMFGIDAVLTRQDDSFLTLKERTAIAAAVPDAVLISLHFNTGPANLQGIQTYYPDATPAPPGAVDDAAHSGFYAACLGLATAVHANSLNKMRSTDGGVRAAEFTILTGQMNTPAILIEGGYLTNPDEAARIGSESYRQRLAEAIAGGVRNYIKARSKGAAVPR